MPTKKSLKLVVRDSGDSVQEIIQLHREIKGHLESSLKKALRLGCLLVRQKEILPHGQFTPWIESSLPFSARTCQCYMRIYNNRDKLNKPAGTTVLSDALRSLRRPPTLPQGKLEGEIGEKFGMTFSLTATEKESIELGLDEVMELLETRSTGTALEYIVLEYLSYANSSEGGG